MIEFKTIHDCRVELVAHTALVADEYYLKDNQDTKVTGYLSEDINADFLPVSAARASFQKEDRTGTDEKADKKLLKFLCEEEHYGVFEHNTATFIIECPLFIRSQIQRHRTFSYNEWSRRYTDQKIAFWIPDKVRTQSKSNKQVSGDEEIRSISVGGRDSDALNEFKYACYIPYGQYQTMIDAGVCREQARAVLPQSLLTQFYMTGKKLPR